MRCLPVGVRDLQLDRLSDLPARNYSLQLFLHMRCCLSDLSAVLALLHRLRFLPHRPHPSAGLHHLPDRCMAGLQWDYLQFMSQQLSQLHQRYCLHGLY